MAFPARPFSEVELYSRPPSLVLLRLSASADGTSLVQ